MKIYVVTAGTYSDYHIIAPTISKKKAERIKNVFSGPFGNNASIEEFEDGEGEDMRLLWECDESGGNAKAVDEGDPYWSYDIENDKIETDFLGRINRVYVRAKDAEHAEKKARDMIAEYKYRKQVEEQK